MTIGAGAGAGAGACWRGLRSTLRRRARRQPLLKDADLVLEVLDGRRGALEQLVDLVAVVAPARLPDVDVAEFLRSHVHGAPC